MNRTTLYQVREMTIEEALAAVSPSSCSGTMKFIGLNEWKWLRDQSAVTPSLTVKVAIADAPPALRLWYDRERTNAGYGMPKLGTRLSESWTNHWWQIADIKAGLNPADYGDNYQRSAFGRVTPASLL